MSWFKVDDKLWGHPKWLATPIRARGLWVTAGSWSAGQEQDGNVPRHVLGVLGGTTRDAQALVTSGLWIATATGWTFHEWAEFQPDSASQKAKRDAESAGGREGNHNRWHVKRAIRVKGCEYCNVSGPDRVPESGANPPVPSRPEPNRTSQSERGSYVTREDEPPMLETSIPRHILPASWAPNTAHQAYAMERGVDINHELRQFKAHCRSQRKTSLDFDAEFEKWLGNARNQSAARRSTDDKVRGGLALAARLAAQEAQTKEIGS